MNVAGKDLFACAALAEQKDGRAGARDILDGGNHILHDLRATDGRQDVGAARNGERDSACHGDSEPLFGDCDCRKRSERETVV